MSHVAPNIDVSEKAGLLAELDKELRKMSMNPIFNPKVYTIGLKLGMIYVKEGLNKFSDWSKVITQDVGEKISL